MSKKRRFSITHPEGLLIQAALQGCIEIMEDEAKQGNLSLRETITIEQMKDIKNRLKDYRWEV